MEKTWSITCSIAKFFHSVSLKQLEYLLFSTSYVTLIVSAKVLIRRVSYYKVIDECLSRSKTGENERMPILPIQCFSLCQLLRPENHNTHTVIYLCSKKKHFWQEYKNQYYWRQHYCQFRVRNALLPWRTIDTKAIARQDHSLESCKIFLNQGKRTMKVDRCGWVKLCTDIWSEYYL